MNNIKTGNVDEIRKKFKDKRVAISLAINNLFPFIYCLRDAEIIPEEVRQNCEEQVASNPGNIKKAIYNILENLEFNELTYRKIFCKENLGAYPDLGPIYKSLNKVLQHAENTSASDHSDNPESCPEEELFQHAEIPSTSEDRNNHESCTGEELFQHAEIPSTSEDRNNHESCTGEELVSHWAVPHTNIALNKGKRIQKKKGKNSHSRSNELKVTCGNVEGILFKNILAKGVNKKCIKDNKGQWFTPREFECKGGHEKSKNWKQSIYCDGVPLKTFIENGSLTTPPHHRSKKIASQCQQQKRTVFSSVSNDDRSVHQQHMTQGPGFADDNDATSVSKDSRQHLWKNKTTEFSHLSSQAGIQNDNGTPDLQLMTQEENAPRLSFQFQSSGIQVQCGPVTGILYKHRFVAGPLRKSIRMEERWCTPDEFLGINGEIINGSWETDIHSKEICLRDLIENENLEIHKDCSCHMCKGNKWAENDDTCAVCKQHGSLICCDACPRSFHKACHTPDNYTTESKKWICTFCNYESPFPVKPSSYTEMFVLSREMTARKQQKCEFLFLKTSCQDGFDLMSNIQKVKQMLQQKEYRVVGCFIHDMRKIFSSCQKDQDKKISEKGRELQEEFEKNFKEVFAVK